MYLLVGNSDDLCCASAHAALEARGCSARIVETLLSHPARLSWRLDSEDSASRLAWGEEQPLTDRDFDGVLVRSGA